MVRRRSVAVAAAVGLAVTGTGLIWLGGSGKDGGSSAQAAGIAHVAYPWAHPTNFRPTAGRPAAPTHRHPPRVVHRPVRTTTAPPPTTAVPTSSSNPGTGSAGSSTPPVGPTSVPVTSTSTSSPSTTTSSPSSTTTASSTTTQSTTSTTTAPSTTASTTTTAPSATSNGSYPCVQTTAQGKCYYPADQYITGASGDPYLNQNIWAGTSTYKQTLHGASPEDWYAMATADTHFGGVLTFPNVGFDMAGSVDSKASVTSSWNTEIPHNDKMAAWAAYDLWFNNWNDEVMIQTDIAANEYYHCDAVATATFDGNPWHMCRFGSERVWKPGTDDDHLQNRTAGSLDIKAILVWMEKNGQLPAGSTWTAASYGFEVCDTGGTASKLWLKGFTWNAK